MALSGYRVRLTACQSCAAEALLMDEEPCRECRDGDRWEAKMDAQEARHNAMVATGLVASIDAEWPDLGSAPSEVKSDRATYEAGAAYWERVADGYSVRDLRGHSHSREGARR